MRLVKYETEPCLANFTIFGLRSLLLIVKPQARQKAITSGVLSKTTQENPIVTAEIATVPHENIHKTRSSARIPEQQRPRPRCRLPEGPPC